MIKTRSKTILRTITLLITIFSLSFPAYAQYNSCSGEPNDPYQIATADVRTPRRLQAVLEGELVYLSWDAPRDSEGLVGYIIFRDEEVISESFVTETSYVEDDPSSGLHSYQVAAFYSNGEINFGVAVECYVFLLAGGSGTERDPFLIATARQLIELAQHPRLMNEHFRLVSDIDLDPNLQGRKVFDSAVIARFSGVFDGDGHTVSNLTIEGDSYLGLFGALGPEAQIIDVNVVNVDVTGNGCNIGVIAGYNSGIVQDCYSSGLVIGHSYVGGLVGSNDNGQIIDSDSTVDVVGIEYVGGLVGSQLAYQTESATVFNSFATGDIFGWHWVGGLVGFNQGMVSKCSARSFVNGSSFLGGLVGYNDTTGLLSNCYSCSTVQGEDALGGLVGSNMGSIRFTYSTGEVIGVSHVGGLVGISDAQAEVLASFWDMEVSGQSSSDGGIGMTTAELQDINTYVDAGWDFACESDNGTENVWYITMDSYPRHFSFRGTGTGDDPYQIDTAWHLTSIGSDPNMLDKHFKLTNHIDLDPNQLGSRVFTRALIASFYDEIHFTGTFDGCGYEIRNMRINGTYNLGLFGCIDPEAQVRNLSIVSAYVEIGDIGLHPKGYPETATSHGLLAGINNGEVEMCHADGSIRGRGKWTGGLIGYNLGNVNHCTSSVDVQGVQAVGGLIGNHDEGQVTDCYSTGTVRQLEQAGDDYVGGLIGLNSAYVGRCYATGDVNGTGSFIGGLVGDNHGTIEQCYSIGAVTGYRHVGGLAGSNDWIVTHSFWDIESSGQSRSAGGWGLSTAQMQDIDTYINAGWDFFGRDFDGDEDIWIMNLYPVLYISQTPGNGTREAPYLISEENKFITLRNVVPSAHYRLTEDIDVRAVQWSDAVVPYFSGSFDGNGFSLRNLTIIGEDYLGLIGSLDRDGTIKNLTLENVFVEGTIRIGGLVGQTEGLITHCECTGVVTGGGSYVGGLVGVNEGHVSDCSSAAMVTGENNVGGIVGLNGGQGNVSNCSSSGTVTGDTRVGGIVGTHGGADIINCYSNATVSGDESRIGGVVGSNSSNVTNCHSIATVSGDRNVGGLLGLNQGTVNASFSGGEVYGISNVGGLVGENQLVNDEILGAVSGCYSTAQVSGDSSVGGLVGYNYNRGSITSSFWDMETSGMTDSDGGTGLTTAEMQTASTFLDAGWDFVDETENGTEDIWWIDEGNDYPRLWWEAIN